MSRALHSDAGPSRAFILMMGAASALSAFGMTSVVPSLPVLARSFEQDYAAIQFVVSAYLLGLGLFQPVQGLLSDRFGRRPVLLAGFAVFAVASLLALLATTLAQLVIARFLQAMGASVATVVTRAIVRDRFEPEPAAVALAFITAVMGVAPIVAPLIGGVVVESAGWRALFVTHVLVAGALLLWLGASLAESRAEQVTPPRIATLFRGFGVLARDRQFVGHSLTYAWVSGASFVFVTIGAALFEQLFDMTGTSFGLFWAALAAAYTGGAALAGTLARRYGSARIVRIGLRVHLAGALLFGVAAALPEASLALYLVALFTQMTANGLVSPLSLAGAVAGRPELAGVASGFSSSIAMLVSMLCAIAAGILFDGSAWRIAAMLIAASVLAWVAARLAADSRHGR